MIMQDLDSFGFPGYSISEYGLIWSYHDNCWIPEYNSKDNAARVILNGIYVTVHILVAKVFIPNPENKEYVKHIDGNKDNNHFSNLKWVSKYEQLRKKNNNDKSKELSEDEVHFICKCLSKGMGHTEIANKYGFPKYAVYQIKRGENWKYISCQYDFVEPKKYSTKLSEDKVRTICVSLKEGKSVSIVAKETNTSYDVVRNISIGKNWRNISKEYFEIPEIAVSE